MTYDFIEQEALWDLLPIVDHLDWQVNRYGQIRDQHERCPLCALADEIGGATSMEKYLPSLAFSTFDLGEPLGPDIMYAADNEDSEYRPRMNEILNPKPFVPYVAPPSFWTRFTTRILSILHNGIR